MAFAGAKAAISTRAAASPYIAEAMVGRHPDPLMLTYAEETKRKPYNVC